MTSMHSFDKDFGIADARKRFSEVLRDVSEHGMRISISNHGRSQAVIVSVEDWESIVATIETMGDTELMRGVTAYVAGEAAQGAETRDLDGVIMDLLGDDEAAGTEG